MSALIGSPHQLLSSLVTRQLVRYCSSRRFCTVLPLGNLSSLLEPASSIKSSSRSTDTITNCPKNVLFSTSTKNTQKITMTNPNKRKKYKPFGYGKSKKNKKVSSNDDDRSDRRKHNTRRPENDTLEEQTPHEGSFAHPAMRKLFDVHLEELSTTFAKADGSISKGGEMAPENPKQEAATEETSPTKVTPINESGEPIDGDGTLEAAKNDDATDINAQGMDEEQKQQNTRRNVKRKVALFLAFVGTEYGGFQMNINQKTLQAQIELALFRANMLSDTNFGFPHKYSWSNSARTDKGVHACAQVCSVKLEIPHEMVESMDMVREAINEHLPCDIRCLDVVRTPRAFCARTSRDRVRYQYMVPSFLLYDRNELRQLFEKHKCHMNGRDFNEPLSQKEVDTLRPILAKYRATPDQVSKLREALNMYKGTQSYHNFTRRLARNDPSRQRYIIAFDAQDPVVMEDGTEWIPTQVTGQAFLLNQIRKMISLAVDIARGAADKGVMTNALSDDRDMKLSIAPAQGLFLDMSIFQGYNNSKKGDPLDWEDSTSDAPAVKRWKDFKENVVMPHVVKEEATDGNFIKYLFLQEYIYGTENYKLDGEQTEEVSSEKV
mmetsp:Transcript_13146/g.18604  ORF Transcript_13146/g.18604 Transcript_13146/m.18604 type:complete len:606 (-) Transcript_13146:48-1865(-)